MAAPTVSDIVEELSEITDPHRLGMHLGLKEEDLKKIETDHPATERRKSEIIYHWRRNFKPCSWKALADAVEKMGGHANLVEKLRALGDQELNDASQISEQESDNNQVEVVNNDTNSKSTPAQFQLNLSGRLSDRPTNKELREHVQKKIGDKWEEVVESESDIRFRCPCGECLLETYLQEGCPKSCIPYLGMTTLSKEDRENLNFILKKDTKKIIRSFENLSNRICDSLKRQEVTVDNLVRVAVHSDSSLHDKLIKSTSVDRVFTDLAPEMSFFNYETLTRIINVLGDGDDKECLACYSKEFQKFCKRKVFEIEPGPCTCGQHLSNLKQRKPFAVVLPTGEKRLKNLGDAVSIKETLADVLGVPLATLHLHRIDRGSIILVFSVPDSIAQELFPLPKEKLALLRTKGMVLFVPQDFTYYYESNQVEDATKPLVCSGTHEASNEHPPAVTSDTPGELLVSHSLPTSAMMEAEICISSTTPQGGGEIFSVNSDTGKFRSSSVSDTGTSMRVTLNESDFDNDSSPPTSPSPTEMETDANSGTSTPPQYKTVDAPTLRTRRIQIKGNMLKIIEELKSDPDAKEFINFIDEPKRDPNYDQKIDYPMCLNEITARINRNQCDTREKFCDEFYAIIENCETYYGSESEQAIKARKLNARFDELVEQHVPDDSKLLNWKGVTKVVPSEPRYEYHAVDAPTPRGKRLQIKYNMLTKRYESRPEPAELRTYVRNHVQDKWEELADELGLDDDEKVSEELQNIKEKWKSDNKKAAFEVLKLWLKHYRTTATWRQLKKALNDVDLQEAVRSVNNFLSSCQNSPSTSGTTQAATAATAAAAATAITQRTSTKEVLTEQNPETMDMSTPQDSYSQPFSCSTKTQYEVCKQSREYQKELAEPGIRGQNYIICAPTNSGKTFVAAMVIANHLEEKFQTLQRKPKVAFVVETLTLADQQTTSLSKDIRNVHVECRTGNRGEDRRQQLHIKDALHDDLTDIIVCTSGKLLDELKKEEISLLEFSLLIIDECHSTECSKQFSNAAAAQIMRKYLELKEASEKCSLPQVIGLTATPGMGKNPGLDLDKVIEYLIMLCAHMDATGGIQTVRQHKEELSRYVQNPESHLDTVDQNERKEIRRIERDMEECEKFLTFSSPFPRWSQQYEQEVKQQRNALHGSDNTEDRDKVSSVRLLEHYSQTLIKYTELPCALATEYLEQYNDFNDLEQSDHEKHLLESFTRLKGDIKSLQVSENPVLVKLELRLTDVFKKKPESSGIVFVRTREQAEAICNWISNSEFASNVGIKAWMFVGKVALTGDEQKEVTDAFRNRHCNLIVATSVAEEGIDIKECNLIVRLHIFGARSQAQMRGHARAEDSEIITIIANDPKKEYKDMANNMLIELTSYLVEKNCLPPYQQLQAELIHRQKRIMEKAREQRMLEKSHQESHPAQDVEIKCNKCKITACRGSDIYCIDKTNHHVVPGEEFTALYEKFDHHSRGILLGCDNPIIMKDYKIHCSECNQSWGVLGTWPSGIPYPIIKCESFSFYVNGNVKLFKKWKDRPFNVSQLSEWFTQSSPPNTC